MSDPDAGAEEHNYGLFRECLGDQIIRRLKAPEKPKSRRQTRNVRKSRAAAPSAAKLNEEELGEQENEDGDGRTSPSESNDDGEELADFIEYLATEMFAALPADLRSLTHLTLAASPSLRDKYSDPLPASTRDALTATLPPAAEDSLTPYADPPALLLATITAYIAAASAVPPAPSTTRPESNECELCGRDQLRLTYHHLVPREVHAKVLKRGWHPKERLESVAWLCRACHSFVHRVAGNEELAREWYTVERLMQREDVQGFVAWIGRVRWKAR